MADPFPYFLSRTPPFPGAWVTVSWGTNQEQCQALIDTGADSTFIPAWLVRRLSLRPLTDEVDVSGPMVPDEEIQRLYAANLSFLGLTFDAHPVVPWTRYDDVIIGRDIINRWVLTLDGPNRTFLIR
jgi:hypothetical protein